MAYRLFRWDNAVPVRSIRSNSKREDAIEYALAGVLVAQGLQEDLLATERAVKGAVAGKDYVLAEQSDMYYRRVSPEWAYGR